MLVADGQAGWLGLHESRFACKAEALLWLTLSSQLQQVLSETFDASLQLLSFICGQMAACFCHSLQGQES